MNVALSGLLPLLMGEETQGEEVTYETHRLQVGLEPRPPKPQAQALTALLGEIPGFGNRVFWVGTSL